jgi:hypothetical protein
MSANQPISIETYELLLRARILSPEELEDSIKLAERMRMSLGRILEMNGYCTETVLPLVAEVQSLVGAGQITLDAAVKAVDHLVHQHVSLEIALNLVRSTTEIKKEVPLKKNKLGDFLLVTGIITKHQLAIAQNKCINTNLPLGMLLVNMGIISQAVHSCAIKMLRLLQDNRIDYDLATHALKRASVRHLSAEESLYELTGHTDFELESSHSNHLLLLSGLVSSSQLLTAMEVELVEDKPITEVFVEFGYVSELCLHSALHLASMSLDGQVSEEQCCAIIKKMKLAVTDDDVNEILSTLDSGDDIEEHKSFEISDVLLASGILSKDTLAVVKPLALSARKSLLRTLVEAEYLDEETAALINETKDILDSGMIVMSQANIALAYSMEHNINVTSSVGLFGWARAVA